MVDSETTLQNSQEWNPGHFTDIIQPPLPLHYECEFRSYCAKRSVMAGSRTPVMLLIPALTTTAPTLVVPDSPAHERDVDVAVDSDTISWIDVQSVVELRSKWEERREGGGITPRMGLNDKQFNQSID